MTAHDTAARPLLEKLALPGGGFAMVAIDQRESLRRMFPLIDGREVDDDTLRQFKRDAIAALAPVASAVLLDRYYGLEESRPTGLGESTAFILAADELEHPPGQPVVTTTLDPAVTPDFARQVGADALKLLVIWREDGAPAEREELVRAFLEVAEQAGVASLLEGIVRPAHGGHWADHSHRHDAILRAAAELSGYGGTIYKAEVPGYIQGDLTRVGEQARQLTELIEVPWVVLSNGVAQSEFAPALAEAVAGGASGFLAGRAVWSDTVREEYPATALQDRAVDRLRRLRSIVAEVAGPRITAIGASAAPGAGEKGPS